MFSKSAIKNSCLLFVAGKVVINIHTILKVVVVTYHVMAGMVEPVSLHYKRSVAALYDAWAGSYDAESSSVPYYRYSDERYLETLARYLNKLRTECVLDVGCGTGAQTLFLAKKGFRVVGIDLSAKSIELAKARATLYRVDSRVDFIVCDLTNLPLRDEVALSLISLGSVMSHVMEHDKSIAELSRVLQSNGYFIIEFDNKWSLDTLYFVAESFLKGFILMNSVTIKEAESYFRTGIKEWVHVDRTSGTRRSVPIRSFSIKKVETELAKYHMLPNGIVGINMATSVLPATMMQNSRLNNLVTFIKFVGKIDRLLCMSSIVNVYGASAIIAGTKLNPS